MVGYFLWVLCFLPCVREFNLYVYDTPIFFVTASVVDSGAHVRKETWFGTRLNVSIRRKATCAQKYCSLDKKDI